MRDRGRKSVAVATALAALVLSVRLGVSAQTEAPPQQEPPKSVQASAPVQPIPFSHKKHVTLGLKCDYCHTNPAPGINVTFPTTKQCMVCHVAVAKNSPAIQKLAEYDKSKQEIPWVRVYAVPAWVNWNHGLHLKARAKCETCHGQVAEMDTTKVATNITSMQGCVDCHQQHDASTGCQTCHDDMGTE